MFRLRTRDQTVITDPYGKSMGFPPRKLPADIVSISHDHDGHNNLLAIKGEPYVVKGPGEYEIRDVFIIGVQTFHDDQTGSQLGSNVGYVFLMDDLAVCHLGDIGGKLSQAQVEDFGDIDVLLIPISGRTTVPIADVSEIINQLDPRIVVPMHYRLNGGPEPETLEKFLAEMGAGHPEPLDDLKVSGNRLPDERQLVVLKPRP